MQDGGTANRQMQRVGKISALHIPVKCMANSFGRLDHGVFGFQQGGKEFVQFNTGLPVAGSKHPFGFQQYGT